MDWDVLYEGFRDEFDFAVIDVGGASGELRAQAFAKTHPVPVLLVDRDLPPELLAVLGGDPVRPVVVATPSLAVPVVAEVVDGAGESRFIELGARRIGGLRLRYLDDLERDPNAIMRELAVRTLRSGPCVVWDAAILPEGDGYALRYRATLRTDDPTKVEALAAEDLMISFIGADGAPTDWPIRILEDATVRHGSGEWRRVVTLSVLAPAPLDDCCLWVWSRVLGVGGFRCFPRWIAELILSEGLEVMRSVARDPGYDAWVKGRRAEGATREVADGASAVHLSVLVVEEPVVPLAGSRSGVADRWAWLPWVANQTPHPSSAELRGRTAASLRAQTHRDFDVRFIGAGEPIDPSGPPGPSGPPAGPSMPSGPSANGDAGGRWSVVVGLGDELEPDALETIAATIAEVSGSEEGVVAVYADEDVAVHQGDGTVTYTDARLKPATFSRDELYFGNGVGLPLAVAPEVLEIGAFSAYELALRALELGGEGGFRHIESVLLHAAASRPFATGGMVGALASHLERRRIPADVVYRETNPAPDPEADPERHPGGVLRIRYGRPDPTPLVSVVIPNRDHADYLGPCVDSILELTRYPRYEVVIVENGSREEATLELYRELQARDSRVRVVGWRGEGFNYPAVVNRGVEKALGDYVCLLNNDTVVLDGDWMDELAGPLLRPEVGVTGALLSFPDGLVQHAGMMGMPDGGLAHQQQNLWPGTIEHGDADGDEGYLMTLQRPVAYTMVTGACQMIRRSVYEELGGYDEALGVGYNDADFCLRAAKAGHRSLFTPYARLMHREFGTRHRETTDGSERERWLGERRLMMERHPEVFGRDPFLNRALAPDSRYFALTGAFWVYESGAWYGLPYGEND